MLGLSRAIWPKAQSDLTRMQEMMDKEGDPIDESAVLFLETENFDAEVKKYKFALVEFMAPWCETHHAHLTECID